VPEIAHALEIDAEPAIVWRALTTPDGLAGWWTRDLDVAEGVGGASTFRFRSGAFNRMRVVAVEAERRLEWECVDGADEWIGTRVEFRVGPDGEGGTRLGFRHFDWQGQTDYLAECSYHWAVYLGSLQRLCVRGRGEPNVGGNAARPADGPTRESRITLREIDSVEVLDTVLALRVSEWQRTFVADNTKSIAQSTQSEYAWPRAVYADETAVGFLMLWDDPGKAVYFLWRLMIDERWQGLGFGREAMRQLIDHVRRRPGATSPLTSVAPKRGGPKPFYESLGFVATGEWEEGEMVPRLDLAKGGAER
jgi:diamine N-acetyltransferase